MKPKAFSDTAAHQRRSCQVDKRRERISIDDEAAIAGKLFGLPHDRRDEKAICIRLATACGRSRKRVHSVAVIVASEALKRTNKTNAGMNSNIEAR